MAVPEPLPAAAEQLGPATWRGSAFGLSVEAASPLPGVPAGLATGPGRRVTWTEVSPAELALVSPAPTFTPLVDLRHADGRAFMMIERDPAGAYRISAPEFGVHVVAADGSSIRSSLPGGGGRRWQRLFFAQVLPLAAALNGLELLHASAVEISGRAVAFSGPSGTGKTSVAAHLVGLGAGFVTDDVLAVEPHGATVRVHSGPALANVETCELAALGAQGRARLGRPGAAGDDGKRAVETTPAPTPLPLGAVCFLTRVPEGDALQLRHEPPGGIQTLLGSSFLPYLRSRARLATHLDVCGRVAAGSIICQLRIPHGASARETAVFLHEQLGRIPSW